MCCNLLFTDWGASWVSLCGCPPNVVSMDRGREGREGKYERGREDGTHREPMSFLWLQVKSHITFAGYPKGVGLHVCMKGKTFTLQGNYVELNTHGGGIYLKSDTICYQQMSSEGPANGRMDRQTDSWLDDSCSILLISPLTSDIFLELRLPADSTRALLFFFWD